MIYLFIYLFIVFHKLHLNWYSDIFTGSLLQLKGGMSAFTLQLQLNK